MSKAKLISYKELLAELSKHESNHLLLGNGFNNSLGISTSYKDIFERMKNNYAGYQSIENDIRADNYDIEVLLQKLKDQILKGSGNFLSKYIERRVRVDFMKAANDIVQENIKSIYDNKNKSIHLLFKQFNKYFSLNYDPFLYLLLLNFKKIENNNPYNQIGLFSNDFKFIKRELSETQSRILHEIEEAKKNGILEIKTSSMKASIEMAELTKNDFVVQVKNLLKKQGFKVTDKDIEQACNYLWRNEEFKDTVNCNDGFKKEWYTDLFGQNIFFLHGAFHLIEERNSTKKLIQGSSKPFRKKIEEAINSENQDIICVFSGSSSDKVEQIKNSYYLQTGFDQLSNIEGNLVIFGSSLDSTDDHIFEQINRSQANHIYISTKPSKLTEDSIRADRSLSGKKKTFFNYETISYEEDEKD